jgi:glycosyltransferase involved in cell wall biosynthesis
MKILYHHRIRSKDGQFVHIDEIVRQLTELGHEVHIVGPAAATEADIGSESRSLHLARKLLPRALYELIEFCYCLVDLFAVSRAIRQFRPDVIYERYNLFLPSGIWAKRIWRLPLILEVNAPLVEERSAFGGLTLRPLARWSQRYAWRGADRVITVTRVLKDVILSYGVDADRIEVMPNGVDPEEFRFDEATRVATRTRLGIDKLFVIGFTGFVRSWHGLERIVDLLVEPEFCDSGLLIVGDGPAIESIQARADELEVSSRVIVTGVVERDKVAEYVASFDVAIQPNVVEYASPLKALEYLAMGRAIVAPRSPNICELLDDGENSLLFELDDQESLRRSLLALHEDDAMRNALESCARQTIVDRKLTWRHNAERVEHMFLKLLDARVGKVDNSIGRSKH